MTEITEVLRQWLAGAKGKQIARRLGLDPKTVRRYTRTAAECGVVPCDSACKIDPLRGVIGVQN